MKLSHNIELKKPKNWKFKFEIKLIRLNTAYLIQHNNITRE